MAQVGTRARPPRQRLTLEITVLLTTFMVVIGVWTRSVVLAEPTPTAAVPGAAWSATTGDGAAHHATAAAHRRGRIHPRDAEPTSDRHPGTTLGARAAGARARDVRLDRDPAGAHAEDIFRLTNKALTAEFDQFFQVETEEGCWYDPNGVFGAGESFFREDSEIAGDDDPFKCDSAAWHSVLYYKQGNYKVGFILFEALDPAIGDATLECQGMGAEFETGDGLLPVERFLTTEVDGRTCTAAPLPGLGAAGTDFAASPGRAYAGHVRLVSSLAPVVGRRAQVQVEVFGLGAARHRVSVDLRMESGMAVGSASRTLRVGDHPRTISVPISEAAWRELKARREFRVHAAVTIQSPGGTGDTTSQLLLRRGG